MNEEAEAITLDDSESSKSASSNQALGQSANDPPVAIPEAVADGSDDEDAEDDEDESDDDGSDTEESNVSDSGAESISKEERRDETNVADPIVTNGDASTSKPRAPPGPRRSRRKNFGNLYEQTITKEKEEGIKPALRGLVLGEPESGQQFDADEDSEEDDADFRPGQANGNETHDESGSDSDSSSDEDRPSQQTDRKPHRSKDPLNAIAEQKRSLDELLNEIAASPKLNDFKICSVCLWDEYDIEKDAVVQCDSCGVPVHEACYGVMGQELEEAHAEDSDSESTFETMPWFCDPCRFGEENPQCVACPNKYGAFKQTQKGEWIHGSCARYIREFYFEEEERLADVVISKLNYGRWGDHPCVICEDPYAKTAGITINCDTGMCRKYLHVTCAMMTGTAAEVEEQLGHPWAVYCPDHCHKEERAGNRRCYLASLGLQRKFQLSLKDLTEQEKLRMDVARKKQKDMYLKMRQERTLTCKMEGSVKPLHSAYWLIMKGHERAKAVGYDAKPMVNANPTGENVRSARPDFRPEFVAYVYKREKQMEECLERMEAAKEAKKQLDKRQTLKSIDAKETKTAVRRHTSELRFEKDSLRKLLSPFLPHMDKKALTKRSGLTMHKSSLFDAMMQASKAARVSPCCVCKSSESPHKIIQCDECHRHYHLGCLDPPLTSVPNLRHKGFKWLCSECAPDSDDDDSEAGTDSVTTELEGGISASRKRRRFQGQNPSREKLVKVLQAGVKKTTSPNRKKRPPTKTPSKSPVKVPIIQLYDQEIQMADSAAASTSALIRSVNNSMEERKVNTVRPKEPRKKREDEAKGGLCCQCDLEGINSDAVECDVCHKWYHFKCLDPPLSKTPRARGYGWHCENCDDTLESDDLAEDE